MLNSFFIEYVNSLIGQYIIKVIKPENMVTIANRIKVKAQYVAIDTPSSRLKGIMNKDTPNKDNNRRKK